MSSVPDHVLASDAPAGFPSAAAVSQPSRKRWTRNEYHRLGEQGWFRGQRVELLGGEIFLLSPQSHEHYVALDRIAELLGEIFGSGYWVRRQGPLALGEWSEPEPDVSVVAGSRDEYADHPRTACLVVEVAKRSQRYDQDVKASLYASGKLPEYWLLDLESRVLLVHRDPIEDSTQPFGWRYASVTTQDEKAEVASSNKPDLPVAVASFLPPR